ncbi:MAG: magnesium chelatase subunit [Acidimicrobiaceae bacterium]|nr:magnesium chelatase subunit [Acidimicrobiaceae bacterium]
MVGPQVRSGERSRQFPFSAVVGQDEVKLALLLAAVDPAIAGVLLRGEKGSAKTTLARALAALLPGDAPFVELPVGATEDRLVGTLDLAAALTGGERRFQAGLLAAAHGGVLYVDEVNLLPDHLVDVLLDVAASGVNRVEREGISYSHPSRLVLIGSMNPEEGDLRPQLLDRFGLAVEVRASVDPLVRAEAVRRRLAFDADPAGFAEAWAPQESELANRLAAVTPAALPLDLIEHVSRLCAAVEAQGLRADLTICRAAAALAGFERRPAATAEDVRRVAPLALAHRRRRGPFDAPGIGDEELERALQEAAEAGGSAGGPEKDGDGGPEGGAVGEADAGAGDAESGAGAGRGAGDAEAGAESAAGVGRGAGRLGRGDERVVAPAAPTAVVRLAAPARGASGMTSAPGRRSTVEGPRGRLVADRAPDGPIRSLAVGATVRAAAGRRAAAPAAEGAAPGAAAPGFADGPIIEADLREAVREQRAGNLIVLAVDASGSMGADRRMEAAKGAVLSLLLDAYQRRDKVAMITFRGDTAEVALKPTSSVEVARARLAELPTGGRTPLAAGIRAALDLATAPGRSGTHEPLLVLFTDGRATSSAGPVKDPVAAARDAADAVRRRGISAVVVDAEDGPTRLGLARELATLMAARYLTLPELSAVALDHAVRAHWRH